jgi:hypothetical protein
MFFRSFCWYLSSLCVLFSCYYSVPYSLRVLNLCIKLIQVFQTNDPQLLHCCRMYDMSELFRLPSCDLSHLSQNIPYLRMYKPHFLTRIYPSKLGLGLFTEYYVVSTTEPAMSVLYAVKLPVETASV